jgi:alpha-ribazole phosphatase
MCYGWTDLDTDHTFDNELNIIKEKIGDISQYQFFSSPLLRCKRLAESLNKETGNITFDKRLRELNFGDWEGLMWDDMKPEIVKSWCDDFINNKVPGGECFQDLLDRVTSFWEEIDMNKDIVIIAHDGVLRAITYLLLKMDKKNIFRIQLEYGTVIRITPWMAPHCKISFL